jgi:hypothetical protein
MNNYYLKFASELAATAALYTAEAQAKYANISVIGVISKPTGVVDAEGNPVMAALEGWHVNVRADVSPELEQYQVFPVAPMRVWAA